MTNDITVQARLRYCAAIHLSEPVSLTATSEIKMCRGVPSAVPRCAVENIAGGGVPLAGLTPTAGCPIFARSLRKEPALSEVEGWDSTALTLLGFSIRETILGTEGTFPGLSELFDGRGLGKSRECPACPRFSMEGAMHG